MKTSTHEKSFTDEPWVVLFHAVENAIGVIASTVGATRFEGQDERIDERLGMLFADVDEQIHDQAAHVFPCGVDTRQ